MTATLPPRRRRAAATALDVVLGILFAAVGLVFGLVSVALAQQYAGINDGLCTGGDYAGLTCNATALTVTLNLMIWVSVIGWALTTGMFIVRLVQRRWGFYFTAIGLALLIAVFYTGTAVVGQIAVTR